MRKKYLYLLLIVLLAGLLRFTGLSVNPPALTWDEASWGYNAYAFGIDGKDEFGNFLPYKYLESFGDFKPPVYAYLASIPVKIFGLNEFTTRFPSAFFGVFTIFVTFFLVVELFSSHEDEEVSKEVTLIALLSSFVLAISPWHIMLSRAAFEANVATFFIVCGVWLFLRSTKKNSGLLIFSIISFLLSLYTFNSARIVTPLLILGLSFGYFKKIINRKKTVIFSVIVGLTLLLPIVPFLLSPQARLRFQEVNIFTDSTVVTKSNQAMDNDHNIWWSKIIHNRRVGYTIEFVKHYFDNLTPDFLYIRGDGNPKFSIQNMGQIYLWELPFLIVGILILFKRKQGNWWVIIFWLLIGIIPAATARETPHALRIEATLPTFQILVAYGIAASVTLFRKKIMSTKLQYSTISLFICVVSISLFYFIHTYVVHYPVEYSGEWQYGYKQAVQYIQSNENQYDRVFMTTDLGRPYIYFLFFMKKSPSEFRNQAKVTRDTFGFVKVEEFDKYIFISTFPKIVSDNKKYLFVNIAGKVPENAKILKHIPLLNNQPNLILYTL